jgi:hypothetical protein
VVGGIKRRAVCDIAGWNRANVRPPDPTKRPGLMLTVSSLTRAVTPRTASTTWPASARPEPAATLPPVCPASRCAAGTAPRLSAARMPRPASCWEQTGKFCLLIMKSCAKEN